MLKLLAKTAPNARVASGYLTDMGFISKGKVEGDDLYRGWITHNGQSVQWYAMVIDAGHCVRIVYGSPAALPDEQPYQPHAMCIDGDCEHTAIVCAGIVCPGCRSRLSLISPSPSMQKWIKGYCLSESEGKGIGPVLGFVSGSPVHPDRDDEPLLGEGMGDPVRQSLEAAIAALKDAGNHSLSPEWRHAMVLQSILDQKHNGIALTDQINDAVFG